MEQYLTVEYAAAMMLCSPETIRRWVRAGKLPAFRAGRRGRYRIPLSALRPEMMLADLGRETGEGRETQG
jgi:excisionase family DNA binding protein